MVIMPRCLQHRGFFIATRLTLSALQENRYGTYQNSFNLF
jgi:hypothetical protein